MELITEKIKIKDLLPLRKSDMLVYFLSDLRTFN